MSEIPAKKRSYFWGELFVVLFGIILPAVTLYIEITSHMCAEEFFDPIPTIWHILLVAFVPLANLAVLIGVRREKTDGLPLLQFINGIALGIALIYTCWFLLLSPLAIIAIIFFGLGLLPLAPLFSFLSALKCREYIYTRIPLSKTKHRKLMTLPGMAVAVLLFSLPFGTYVVMGSGVEPIPIRILAATIVFIGILGGVENLCKHIFGDPVKNVTLKKIPLVILKAEIFSFMALWAITIRRMPWYPPLDFKVFPILGIIGFAGILALVHTASLKRREELFLVNNAMMSGLSQKMVAHGKLVGRIAGGIVGVLIGILAEEFGVGLLGLVVGAITGGFIGMAWIWATILGYIFTRFIAKTVYAALAPFFILFKFRTILCNHCFRFTQSLKSRYENGIRYCEHCQQDVEKTHDPGKVVLTFGNVLIQQDGRVFLLSDPDFEQKVQPVDVSEVYIDTTTTDKRLLERFITYVINHPPRYGINSVRVLYQGEFDELGANLKNSLENNFMNIEMLER